MAVEVRTVNLSKEEAFDHLKDYFSEMGVKVIGYKRPIHLHVEFGQRPDTSSKRPLGQVFITIRERDGKTYLIFDFDFKHDRFFGIFYHLVFLLGVGVFFVYSAPRTWSLIPLVPVPFVPVSAALFIAVVLGLFGAAIYRQASRTRSRFMNDVTSALP